MDGEVGGDEIETEEAKDDKEHKQEELDDEEDKAIKPGPGSGPGFWPVGGAGGK